MPAVAEVEATVRKCIEKKTERLDNPHRDTDVLCYFYHDSEMSTRGVGDKLGTSHRTIINWLNKTDLGARSEDRGTRVEKARYNTTTGGHEKWNAEDPDDTTRAVGVHQLLAVADGADPEDVWAEDTHVHHRTGVPWLNIEGGVEVLTTEEHGAVHREGEWTEEDGIPVLEAQE